MLRPEERADVEAYDRSTAAQLAEQNRPDPKPYTIADHLDAQIRFQQEEIAFQGEEIGMLAKTKTAFRKVPMIVGLCEMHARICDDMMQEATDAIERLKAEKKSLRV